MGNPVSVAGKQLTLGKKEPAKGWKYSERRGNFASVVREVGVDEAVVAAILWDKPDCDIEWCIRCMYLKREQQKQGIHHKDDCMCVWCLG